MLLPQSLSQLIGLLTKKATPQTILRLFESKEKLLQDSQGLLALRDLFQRFLQRPSRRKVKIESGAAMKVLDVSSSFVEWGLGNELVKELNAFDVSRAGIQDLYQHLLKVLLSHLALELGVKDASISPDVYSKLDIAYFSRVSQALSYIQAHHPEKLPRSRALLKAMLEDKIWDLLENTEQIDETGRSIANHNKKVRNAMTQVGIRVDHWLGRQNDQRMPDGLFVYNESSQEETPYKPIADAMNVADYIKRMLNAGLAENQTKQITDYLKRIGLIPERNGFGEVTQLQLIRGGKHKDLVAVISNASNLRELSELIDGLVRQQNIQNLPATLETISHLQERVQTLTERLKLPQYQKELGKLRKFFKTRPIFRNPGHDLFIGDYTGCCLAMN